MGLEGRFYELFPVCLRVVRARGLLLISGSGVRVSDGAPENFSSFFGQFRPLCLDFVAQNCWGQAGAKPIRGIEPIDESD